MQRSDGRLYSFVSRRLQVIMQHMPKNTPMSSRDISRLMEKKKVEEMYLKYRDRYLAPVTIGKYTNLLATYGLLACDQSACERVGDLPEIEDEFDTRWIEVLSGKALKHLAKLLQCRTSEVPGTIKDTWKALTRDGEIPSLKRAAQELGFWENTNAEPFRWSMYVYTDGPRCPLEIRRYPAISI